MTIHNINDPKFTRKPTPVSLRDGVEITRINGPDGFITNSNLAFGGQRQSVVNTDDLTNSANSEFGGMFSLLLLLLLLLLFHLNIDFIFDF